MWVCVGCVGCASGWCECERGRAERHSQAKNNTECVHGCVSGCVPLPARSHTRTTRRHIPRIPTHPALPAPTLTPHSPPPHPPTTIPPTPAPHTTHAKDNTECVCVCGGGEQGVWGCVWCVPQGGVSVREGGQRDTARQRTTQRVCGVVCLCGVRRCCVCGVCGVCLSVVRI